MYGLGSRGQPSDKTMSEEATLAVKKMVQKATLHCNREHELEAQEAVDRAKRVRKQVQENPSPTVQLSQGLQRGAWSMVCGSRTGGRGFDESLRRARLCKRL